MRHSCDLCDKSYTIRSNLMRHRREVHKISNKKVAIPCSLCGEMCLSGAAVNQHIELKHQLPIVTQHFTLKSIEEFKRWKDELEMKTGDKYAVKSRKQNTVYYRCNKSGRFKSKSKGIREFSTGSMKEVPYCPSVIRLKEMGRVFRVEYVSTHVPHESVNHSRERLSINCKRFILAELMNGTVEEMILAKAKEKFKERTREWSICAEDIKNVRRAHFNDPDQSVSVFIESMLRISEEQRPLMLYKLENGENCIEGLQDEDIFIALMSQVQAQKLKTHGRKMIVIDSTHDLNGYELTTLMVLDSDLVGIPVAFLISTKVNRISLIHFFTAIKHRVGTLHTDVLMTDDDSVYLSAWTSVMTIPTHKLLCTLNLRQCWTKRVKKFKDESEKKKCLGYLQDLQYESNVEKFEKKLQEFTTNSRFSSEFKSFVEWFEEGYVGKKEQWAACYRDYIDKLATKRIDRYHRVFKHRHLRAQSNKRLDSLLSKLCIMTEEGLTRCIDLLYLNHNSELDFKQRKIRNAHKIAKDTEKEQIEIDEASDCEIGESKYMVASLDCQNKYEVIFVHQRCPDKKCPLGCMLCHRCLHDSRCNCPDFCARNNLCKHIHLVALNVPPVEPLVAPDAVDSVTTHTIVTERIQLSDEVVIVDGTIDEQHAIMQVDESENDEPDPLVNIEMEHSYIKPRKGDVEDMLTDIRHFCMVSNEALDYTLTNLPEFVRNIKSLSFQMQE